MSVGSTSGSARSFATQELWSIESAGGFYTRILFGYLFGLLLQRSSVESQVMQIDVSFCLQPERGQLTSG